MTGMPATRKAAVWLAAIFLLGGALGGVLGFAIARYSSASAASVDTPEARRVNMLERFDHELHLTESQKAALAEISSTLQAQYKSIHQQTDPQMNEARENARNRIRAILTPEQKPKFEELIKRLDEERKHKGH